jgi:NADPH-dependent 2,4-dienoyl-CoA reductase/sulfur reductase-like enzyme/nitrite reductase/ring-hydroxylating ferredoxin subunit
MQNVAAAADIILDRGKQVEIGDTKILLVRDGDAVRAYQGTCPHAGAPLAEGAVCNGRIVCPWHKATFSLRDGALLEPPALKPLARYAVRVEGGQVLVGDPIPNPARQPKPDGRTALIVGAGAAGAAAVAFLREAGFDGRLVIIGREPDRPYDRTVLSKFVMSGDMAPDDVPALLDPEFCGSQRIERIVAEATRLDAAGRCVHLHDGRVLSYDMALAAPGGAPKPLEVPGAELAGVHVLRSRGEIRAILRSLTGSRSVVVVGGSFIGLETASALRQRKLAVTVVSPGPVPFAKQFGDAVGGMVRDLHEAHGVAFRVGGKVERLEGQDRVRTVVLEGGERLAADAVIVGIGVSPATGFIDGVQKLDDGGVVVDAALRAAEGLHVVGDVAAFPHAGAQIRVEHWRLAQQHARVAARAMLGYPDKYDGVPFFWTYHFGQRIEYLGHAEAWDGVVIDGDLTGQKFVAMLVKDGCVAAIVACQREHETALLAELMRNPISVAEARRLLSSRVQRGD